MRAVVLRGIDDLVVEHRADPALPERGVVIQMAYAGVCGSDVRNLRHGSSRLSGPQTPGHEVVGVVVKSDDRDYAVGARVAVCPGAPCLTCDACHAGRHNLCARRIVLGYDFAGAMQESFAVPADALRAGCIVTVPAALPLRAAVLAEPLHTVINGQDLARIAPGDTVLIFGLGTIGTLHAMHALSLGAARVLALDPRKDRVDRAESVIGRGRVMTLNDATEGELREQSWSVVIIAAGAGAAVDLAMAAVSDSGRILAFAGLPPGSSTVAIDVNRIHYRQIELIGAFGGTPGSYARAVAWLARGEFDLEAMVTHEFSIDDAREAYENVERGVGLKTVLRGPASEG